MIKKVSDQIWFPFWVDKWIFGSMRLEFNAEERSMWIDLLALAAKDSGYIRANETTPYLYSQLAGMLIYNEDFFKKAIEKFINKEKLQCDKNGILYVTNWEKYGFSDVYKRKIKQRIKEGICPPTKRIVTENVAPVTENVTPVTKNVNHIISNHIISNHINIKKSGKKEHEIETEFEEFWKFYKTIGNPKDDSGDKGEANKAYKILRRTQQKETIARACHGYDDHFVAEADRGFIKKKMYASTFLRSKRWERFLEYKHEPRL